MKKIKFTDVLPHLLAVLVFLVVTLAFFSPIFFDNKTLDQNDIQQHIASSKSLRDFRDATGEEGLWASSMFGGMPAYLVNLQWSDGVVVTMKKVLSLFLPHPVRNIFAAFICYYILLLAFRVRPYLAIAGALAFGLSSYMIIGLSAGHNARIGAIAFMPLVIAGIHLAFSGKRILGFGVTAAGLAFQLRENHMQITYYLILIVVGYGIVQLIIAYREKQLKDFFTTLAILVPAALIAAATFFGQFWAITEYSRYSIRGSSELQKPGQTESDNGLSKEYAFAYNYGIWEPMTLLIPQIYGGSSMTAFVQDQESESYKALVNSGDNELANQLANYSRAYWGPQSFTVGPYYAGAIVVFLFVLGILFAERKYVYWLVPLSVLSLMLSWGDSFSTFNYFMFDYFPGYHMFRSFSFGLVIILFAMPLLGMLGLEKFLNSELNKHAKSKLMIAAIATGGLCLFLFAFAGMITAIKTGESQLPGWFQHALQLDRVSLLREDAFRSLAFIASIFILLYFNIQKKLPIAFFAFTILMITLDVSIVDKRYFTKDNYKRKRSDAGFAATAADEAILRDKTCYRVYNISPEESFSNSARSSYFHNSLNGYHGAKIRRYQDLYDSCISRETQELINDAQSGKLDFSKYGVLDMLNTKYIVYGPDAISIIPNDAANGPAWFVNEVVKVKSPTEELKKTGEVNTRKTAVVDESKFKVAAFSQPDSIAAIKLTVNKPNQLTYESLSSSNGVAVFSEIYYAKGWQATIDGNEVPILRADYVLRALEVPAGKHSIEFRFQPKPYVIGNKITIASSWILLLVVLGSLGWSLKKP
ncbi:YfhO family protein [soil metagenome]